MTGHEHTPRNGAAKDPTGPLVARTERAAQARAHELEVGLSWHTNRLRAASENARRELEAGATVRHERLTRTLAVTSSGNRQAHRVLDRLHAQGRRARTAVAGALAVAVVAATGAFVATQSAPREQQARRSTSTSIARSSPSTAATTARPPDSLVASESPPPSEAPPASPAPAPRPGASAAPGTSSAARGQAPGTSAGPGASPPGSTGAPPGSASPPSSPPRPPTCQLLPVLCP